MVVKHNIISLDAWVKPPDFGFEYDVSVITDGSAVTKPEQLKDATIFMTAAAPVTRTMLDHAPNLQLVACNGTGTDHIDHDAVRDRGITLCRVPAQNTESVSEHAFALYYALRRRILPMHQLAMDAVEWPKVGATHFAFGRSPRTNAEETLVVIGHGAIGQKVAKIGKALDMRVLVAERKGAIDVRKGRTPFDEALKQGTIFILITPLDASTRDTIAAQELETMDPTAFIINVGRGGVVNERDLIHALRAGKIGGAATDVFEREPASKDNSPLLDPSIPNLIVSPHIAWYSSKTVKGTYQTVKSNIEGFVAGNPQNVVIAGKV